MRIMAIDPGNMESAYCVVKAETMEPLRFDKISNEALIADLAFENYGDIDVFVIERVASYGMPVGREVFDTCEWIGRFTQVIFSRYGKMPRYIFRMQEKQVICHSNTAGDANIRRALIDKYAKHDLKNGKGTIRNPDWFYGFRADIWAAYAVAETYNTIERSEGKNEQESRGL